MNSTPVPEAARPVDPADPLLRMLSDAVHLARSAAQEVAGDQEVGEHVGVEHEDDAAVTHLFDANTSGYRGWRWAVTVAGAGVDFPVSVSEVVLLPGPDALVAPEWVPWQQRVQAGDLGVGDLMPTAPDDPRLVPGYLESDDPAVEAVAMEAGLGRARVMSRSARLDAAARWKGGEFGPRSDMARGAPGPCGSCGFYLPLAGSLSAAFGVCGNEIAPADGHLVHAEYGCGAHSEAEVEQVSPVLVADLIYDDDAMLDIELVERAPAESEPAVAEPAPDSWFAGPESVDALIAGHPVTEEAEVEPVAVAETIAVPEAEPVAELEPIAVAETEPEPVAVVEPEPVAVDEPEPEAADELEPVAEAEPVAVAEPEPVAAVEAEPVAVPEPVAEETPWVGGAWGGGRPWVTWGTRMPEKPEAEAGE